MKCPYCTSDISDEALACPHCAHDLYLFKPLLAKMEALEARLAEQPQIEALEQRIRDLEERLAGNQRVPDVAQAAATPAAAAAEFLLLWGAPLALLLAAHLAITVVYDLNVAWLRFVSLLIPLPFGVVLMNRRWRSFGVWTAAAFVMALLAVLGMSWVTHLVDNTPVLPQDVREWKEFIEYAASVGLSFVTGMVVGRMLWRRRKSAWQTERGRGLVLKLARALSTGKESADKIHATVKKIHDIRNSVTIAATSAASVYTGLHGVIGSR
jgi:hypothetical protein